MKRIILTGGGTAGHVTPNIALLPRLKELQYDIHYIGSYNGIEKELISQFGIPYHASQPVNSDVISASRTSQIHSALSREWVKHVN